MKKSKLKVGDKVTYIPTNVVRITVEPGKVKSIPNNGNYVFVVFNCNNEWDKWMDYTGQSVGVQHLKPGWIEDDED